jgi:argininosuccinate lyase
MTLWDKDQSVDSAVLAFSAGDEYMLDSRLVPYDCLASRAHARMLHKIGVLTKTEARGLDQGLREIQRLHAENRFPISREQEDCHTAIEEWLISHVGEAGEKIHLGRSRNDQVLAAIRLYQKHSLKQVGKLLGRFKSALLRAIAKSGEIPMPGYTHMQRAMPSKIGTWLGAFAAAVDDDLQLLDVTRSLIDQSPLGTGAGYGIPVFRLDRRMTARDLKFDRIQQNPVYAQMSRGKFEGAILNVLSQVMFILNRLASDLLIYSTKEFGFISLPESLCTGSSIMPQKMNPDVLELVRAKYYDVLTAEFKVKGLIGNLMSGYQRDLGLTKKPLFDAIDTTISCLEIMRPVVTRFKVNRKACMAAMSEEIYATEEAYRLVAKGMPFRRAYKMVGQKYVSRRS